MRDRNVMAVYVLGALAVIGGIVAYNTYDDTPDGQTENGPTRRFQGGQGVLIDLSLPDQPARREQPEVSGPATRVAGAPATHVARSAAGGGSSAPAARPTLVSTQPACSTSLLGSVLGLLGSLLGGGGGC